MEHSQRLNSSDIFCCLLSNRTVLSTDICPIKVSQQVFGLRWILWQVGPQKLHAVQNVFDGQESQAIRHAAEQAKLLISVVVLRQAQLLYLAPC